MNIEITKKFDNALFGRKDIEFVVRHEGEATPNRVNIRQLVAGEIGSKTENVVIARMRSETGISSTRGIARAYENADLARAQERVHFLKRNNLYKDPKKEADE